MNRMRALAPEVVPIVESNARLHRGAPGLKTRIFSSIREIDPELWDSLLDVDDVQATHRFITACEKAQVGGAAFRYLLFERDRRLVGWAGLCQMEVSLDLLADPGLRRVVQLGRLAWPRLLRMPVLFCGPPVSFGQSWFRLRAPSDAPAVLAALVDVLEDFALELKTSLICFKEFTDQELPGVERLVVHGYIRAPSLPGCRLAIRWPDLAGYRADMRSGYRRQWDATRTEERRRGLELRRIHDLSHEVDGFVSLYNEVMEHARNRLEWLERTFFLRLAECLPGELRRIDLRDEGRTVASALLLRSPGTLYFMLAGLDYADNRQVWSYPMLVSHVVAEAIESGAEMVELGQTSYGLKTRLGARTTPRWIFLKHVRPGRHRWLVRGVPRLFPPTPVPVRRVFHA